MRALVNALLLFFPLAVTAATPVMFVTDRVPVGLHGANDAAAPIVKQITSGAPVQVQERDGALFKVRTEDGSVGWIEPTLLSNEKPLQQLYVELRDQLSKAQDEIKTLRDKGPTPVSAPVRDESKVVTDLRAELKGAHEQVAELERVAHENTAHLNDASARVAALENENAALKIAPTGNSDGSVVNHDTAEPSLSGATNNKRSAISLPWFFASSFLVLLLGGAIGAYTVDWYIRKRHGGFRIY